MKRTTLLVIAATLLSLTAGNAQQHRPAKKTQPIEEVHFTQVQLGDRFWLPRIETNRTVSIPSAFRECEASGHFDNFNITGGIGSRLQGEGFGPDCEQNNHTAYCETCAVLANVYWNHRMFLATGESKYIDACERAIYNKVLSTVSLSGDKFFCDSPLESGGEHERQHWSGCACCPGNITRFVASVPGYVYARQGSDIYVNLYVTGKARIGNVELEQTTDYPWDGKIRLRVTRGGGRFAIKLRLPSWLKQSPTGNSLYTYADKAPGYTVSVTPQGKTPQHLYPENRDYVSIERQWKKGDLVELDLPMPVRRIRANDNVEDDRGKVALERGPIVYCIEGKDQTDGCVFNKYLLNASPVDARYDARLLGGIVVLDAPAKQKEQSGEVSDVTLRAIPYAVWNNRGSSPMTVWIASTPEQ